MGSDTINGGGGNDVEHGDDGDHGLHGGNSLHGDDGDDVEVDSD